MISWQELFDVFLMTAVIGFIFMDMFKSLDGAGQGFGMRAFLLSCAVTGPSIVAHELAHKFTAIAFGIQATFHAFYEFLGLGLLLKWLKFPFLFIVPGYVSMESVGTPLVRAAIAFAGPLMHLIFWRLSVWKLARSPPHEKVYLAFFVAMREINKLLFILNLLPIPPLDGFHVARNLLRAFA